MEPTHYSQEVQEYCSAKYGTGYVTRAIRCIHGRGQEQVSSEIPIYHMHVKRVYVDNEGVLLYQN